MSRCQKCHSPQLMEVSAKCSDCCSVGAPGYLHDGYVPHDLNIGGGDCVEFTVCMNCGHMQGKWPIEVPSA